MQTDTVGKIVPRKEGRSKVTGAARYVDDLTMPDMLHGVTVRSPAPRSTALECCTQRWWVASFIGRILPREMTPRGAGLTARAGG